MAKERKLKKEFNKENGNILIVTELITETTMEFDFSKYPKEIQEKLGPFGMAIKLGNAASALKGQEAVNAIMATHEEMLKGNWNRGHTIAGASKAEVTEKYAALPEGEQARARKLLEKLGITI
jgi:hypothetical protein